MLRHAFPFFTCCAMVLLIGCDDGTANNPRDPLNPLADGPALNPLSGGKGNPTGGAAIGQNARTGLPVAFGLPRVSALSANMSRYMVVEAVYGASQLSGGAAVGRVVNVGTITVTQLGAQYQGAPQDRLVVKLGDQTHEFVVKQAVGNQLAADATTWLSSPHRLQYTHRVSDQAEGELSVQFDGSQFEVTVTGWSKMHGRRYQIDLKAKGRTVGKRDFHGQEFQTQYTLTGSVRGDGIEVDVNETHDTTLVAASSLRLLPSQRGSASRYDVTINSTLRCDGDTYRFEGVRTITDQKAKGGTGNAAAQTTGTISRNGQPFAACSTQGGASYAVAGGKMIRLDAPE